MYRIIVTDYDGTLIQNSKEPSNAFYTKLNMLVSRGIIFAVASGRPYNQLKKLLYPISNEIVFIASDGAQMMYKNCLLYKKTVDVSVAKAVSKKALDSGMTPIVALREENRKVTEEKLGLPFFFSSDIFKIVIAVNGKDTTDIKNFAIEKNLRVCYENDEYLELCNKDSDKGEAVKKLMTKFSVNDKKILVMGDGINDVSMLKLAEKRICPKNACNEVALISEQIENIEKYILNLS